MSDYLDSLLTRSFAPSLDVRPRLPSRFESPAPGATALTETESTVLATDSPRSGREASSPAMAGRPVAPPDAVAGRDDVSSTGLRRLPAAGTPPVAAETRTGAATNLPMPPPSPREAPAHIDLRSPAFPPSESVVFQSLAEFPAAKPAMPASEAPPPRSDRAPGRDDAPATGMVVRPAVHARERDRPDGLTPAATGRAERPALEEIPPAPQIQVTIGRVEIRASPPPAAPAPRARRDPALSLETYLQRRAEGGRR